MKLLPCPFCGYVCFDGHSHVETTVAGQVKCFSCGASVYEENTEKALQKWNTRTIPSNWRFPE